MQKSWIRYALIPLLVVALCCGALFVSGLMPNSRIRRTMQTSAVQRLNEGLMPQYINRSMSCFTADGYTETLILVSTLLMDTSRRPESILTNPLYSGPDPNEALLDAAMNDVAPSGTYVRYWQGFRAPLRVLFTFFNYEEVRVIIQLTFSLLLILAVLVIARRLSNAVALSFALSVAAMNIIVISMSIQHSICFLLSFIFVLYTVKRFEHFKDRPGLSFVVFGMLTQFFDFYTVPLLSFFYPFLLFFLMIQQEKDMPLRSSFGLFIRCLLAWVAGYAGMWLVKLALVTLFTPINGFEDGFRSFAARIGLRKPEKIAATYSPVLAITYALRSMIGTIKMGIAGITLAFTAALWLAVRLLKRRQLARWWHQNAFVFLMVFFPFVWFSLTASPTYLHAYFQYRTLAVSVFCALLIMMSAFRMTRRGN